MNHWGIIPGDFFILRSLTSESILNLLASAGIARSHDLPTGSIMSRMRGLIYIPHSERQELRSPSRSQEPEYFEAAPAPDLAEGDRETYEWSLRHHP